ncbi:MAG: acetyltransferase [Clostridia bacterium]|nr:acetyltransferase [Clostridia bacterium]
MKDIVIIGAGGFGREVAQLIKDINKYQEEWNLLGYIDEDPNRHGLLQNDDPILGGFEWFAKNTDRDIYTVCAIGKPKIKYSLINKANAYNVNYANLIHPSVIKNDFVEMGTGNIVCANSILSVNVKLGNHIAINPGCSIGHDTVIHDYSSFMWDITVSGNVIINEGCEIGSKSVIIQQKSVGKWNIIGAGAVVIRDTPENCTVVGVPAKPIKFS